MEFKQLEAFAAVVTLGSFSKAGERLFLTQPTITAHVQSLEKELGVRLLERTTREVYPTEQGRRFYPYAQNLLRIRDSATAAMAAPIATDGVVTAAASTVPARYLLPGWMGAFGKEHPRVTFRIQKCDSEEVSSRVAEGIAELGLTGAETLPEHCEYEPLCADPLVVITPNTAAYRHRKGFSAVELVGETFLLREAGSGTRRVFERFLAARGMDGRQLRVAAEIEDPEAIKRAVAQGMGISILSSRAAADFCAQGMLLAFPVEGEEIARRLYLATAKGRPLSAAARAFCAFVRRAAKEEAFAHGMA